MAVPVDVVVQDFLDKTTPKWVAYLDSLKKQKIEERGFWFLFCFFYKLELCIEIFFFPLFFFFPFS